MRTYDNTVSLSQEHQEHRTHMLASMHSHESCSIRHIIIWDAIIIAK